MKLKSKYLQRIVENKNDDEKVSKKVIEKSLSEKFEPKIDSVIDLYVSKLKNSLIIIKDEVTMEADFTRFVNESEKKDIVKSIEKYTENKIKEATKDIFK